MKKQEFIELFKNAKRDKKGNLYYISKDYCNKRVYFATVTTVCDDFVKEYCCDANGECYHYNRHFTNNDDTIEIQIVKGEKQKPKTNFDRITESTESLAAFIVNNTSNCYHCFLGIDGKCEFALKYLGDEACLQSIKEWLQKECEG